MGPQTSQDRRPEATSQAPASDTRERILDAAERLFTERGVGGTSLRAITSVAGVNVAAIHYHFGGKDGLLRALIERHVVPVNRERLRLLDQLEAGGAQPGLEALLDAFVRPAFDAARVDPDLRNVGAILQSEPLESVRQLVDDLFGPVGARFHPALVRALPEIPDGLVGLRFQFVVGVMIHVLSGLHTAGPIPVEPVETDPLVRETVGFLVAGLRAPA